MSKKTFGVYRRGNVYWFAWTILGKRYRQSLKTSDEAEAMKRASEWKSAPAVLLSRQLEGEISDYLAERLASGKLRPVTIAARRCALTAFRKTTGCTFAAEISEKIIRAWYENRKEQVALCTADLNLKIIRAFCRWLVTQGRLRFNPAASLKPSTYVTPARTEFCDAATMDRLIADAPTDRLRFILLAGFDAGLRRNEIVQARRDWFDLNAGSITVRETPTFKPKTNRPRSIPITSRFLAFMREKHAKDAPESFILSPEQIIPCTPQYRVQITTEFDGYMVAQEVPWIHMHTMRRTFASLRVSAGVSIYKVSAWLGDRLATTERHYARLVPVDDEIERVHRAR